jgi:putative ABC transport system ATP-binding protein
MENTAERMARLPADVPRDAIIVTRHLQRDYDMGGEVVHALQGVDLTIRQNEFVAIMGPSGSGKSTLMNLIGCLDSPTAGEYWLNGHRVSELEDDELARIRNREIGFVFQTFNLLPRASALHNVELPLVYAGVGGKERRAVAGDALARVGLGDRMHHRPNELSGGQRQRVAIARAILKDPAVLILDEATSSLDTESERLIEDALSKLLVGRTTLIIAHRLSTVQRADRLVVIDRGRIVEEGTHAELLAAGGLYARLYQRQFREGAPGMLEVV